jgi:phosphorylcholine metabolism protein LicD
MANSQLDSITSIINDLGVRWWIDSGTLLGKIRDNELIPGDDIDISCFSVDKTRLLRNVKKFRYEYGIRI